MDVGEMIKKCKSAGIKDVKEGVDNADFNILQQCMEELPSKWKLAITQKYLTDKKYDQTMSGFRRNNKRLIEK
jgi:DNA-directed RNA polymerase specialized sigma24 family protein